MLMSGPASRSLGTLTLPQVSSTAACNPSNSNQFTISESHSSCQCHLLEFYPAILTCCQVYHIMEVRYPGCYRQRCTTV